MQYLQRVAGAVLGLSFAALLTFWTVKGTQPSGSAVLPILYAVIGTSAAIWLAACLIARWMHRRKSAGVRLVEEEIAAAQKEAEAIFFDGAALIELEKPWKDWREKIATYLGKVLGPTLERKFLAVGVRMPFTAFVRRDMDLLIEISEQLQADAIKLDQPGLEAAGEARRENDLMRYQPIQGGTK